MREAAGRNANKAASSLLFLLHNVGNGCACVEEGGGGREWGRRDSNAKCQQHLVQKKGRWTEQIWTLTFPPYLLLLLFVGSLPGWSYEQERERETPTSPPCSHPKKNQRDPSFLTPLPPPQKKRACSCITTQTENVSPSSSPYSFQKHEFWLQWRRPFFCSLLFFSFMWGRQKSSVLDVFWLWKKRKRRRSSVRRGVLSNWSEEIQCTRNPVYCTYPYWAVTLLLRQVVFSWCSFHFHRLGTPILSSQPDRKLFVLFRKGGMQFSCRKSLY